MAIEHYVTNQIQQKIFAAMNQLPVAEFGAKVVVACPPGEEHDIAAFAVAYRCRVYSLGANVPLASLTSLCGMVKPDLTTLSVPLALSDAKATELIQTLVHDVRPISQLAVGGHDALAIRDLFVHAQIEVLEDFVELDHRVDRVIRQSLSRR